VSWPGSHMTGLSICQTRVKYSLERRPPPLGFGGRGAPWGSLSRGEAHLMEYLIDKLRRRPANFVCRTYLPVFVQDVVIKYSAVAKATGCRVDRRSREQNKARRSNKDVTGRGCD
ncbi:hypothetical protein ACJJTC_009955, partial [Scirpophaga incertulas]